MNSPQEPSEGAGKGNADFDPVKPILDFGLPELLDNKCGLFLSHQACNTYSSNRKPIQSQEGSRRTVSLS